MYKYKTKYFEILNKETKINKLLIKICLKAYHKNRDFFQMNSKFFSIQIANSEEEFKKLAGKFYDLWVKGVSKEGKIVIIRNFKLYDECYKKFGGTPNFEMVLTHEINHIFSKQLFLYKGPYWFTEGLAMYVANQIPGKTYHKKVNFSKEKIKYYLFYRLLMKKLSDEMYIPQYFAVKYLVDNYGKESLLQLIRMYEESMKKINYEENFKKIFGLSYTCFLQKFISKFLS